METRRPSHLEMREALQVELDEVEKQLAGIADLQTKQRNLQGLLKGLDDLIANRPAHMAGAGQIGSMTSTPPGASIVPINLATRPRTLLESAERVLTEAAKPLHIREIVARMQLRGWVSGEYEVIRSSLVSQANKKAKAGQVFVKLESPPSTYGLVVWNRAKENSA